MEIIKTEYKITKNNDIFAQMYDTYTIEKIITYDNREKETRIRTFIPSRDGNINKIDLNSLYFPITINYEEWKQLPKKYNDAWIKGKITKTMSKEIEKLVLSIRARKRMEGCVV